jgi:uncharacterized protein (UPF0264 family)
MRLLVSVRSAAEVAPAVAGGADIVDAKEPSRGSLGAVSGAMLRAIAGCLPAALPLSVALGEPRDVSALAAATAMLDGLEPRPAPVYIKIGLSAAGIGAEAMLRAAVAAGARSRLLPLVIAVAYADHAAAGVPSPEDVTRLAQVSGVRGVLLDTWGKDGRDLFHHVAEPRLRAWVEAAQAAGLLVALAGSLTVDGVRAVAGVPADVVGVRGAACIGGRNGVVAEAQVAELKAVLAGAVLPSAVRI